MSNNNDSSFSENLTLQPNSIIQLPDADIKSLTILNPSEESITVRELPSPALMPYSFAEYNAMDSTTALFSEELTKPSPLGEISTKFSEQDGSIVPENITKRLAAYTKLNKFSDKNNLMLDVDFYNPDVNWEFPVITKLAINNNVPLNWKWGTNYTTYPNQNSTGRGVGVINFENPNWEITFTITNFYQYLHNSNAQYRIVAYTALPDYTVISSRNNNHEYASLKCWTTSLRFISYNSDTETATISVPTYEFPDMPLNSSVYIALEKSVAADEFARITPLHKVILRYNNLNEIGALNSERNVRPVFAEPSIPDPVTKIVLNSVGKVRNNDFYFDYSIDESIFELCKNGSIILQHSYSPTFAFGVTQKSVNSFTGSKILSLSSTTANLLNSNKSYFRIIVFPQVAANHNLATLTSNIIAWPEIQVAGVTDQSGSSAGDHAYCFAQKKLKGLLSSDRPDDEVFYLNYPWISRDYIDKVSRSFVVGVSNPNSPTTFFWPIAKFAPNNYFNIFAFANFISKPYPEAMPFGLHPGTGKDAYRFVFDLANSTFSLFHGSNTVTFNPSTIQASSQKNLNAVQLNTYPFFNKKINSISCRRMSFYDPKIYLDSIPTNQPPNVDQINVDLIREAWNNVKIYFKKGLISVYLNNTIIGYVNDPFYSSRNIGDYVGVTTSHILPTEHCFKLDYANDKFGRLPASNSTSSPYAYNVIGSPGEVAVSTFKVNSQELLSYDSHDIESLSNYTLQAESGLEINGITNSNQIFVQNNSNKEINIKYRALK